MSSNQRDTVSVQRVWDRVRWMWVWRVHDLYISSTFASREACVRDAIEMSRAEFAIFIEESDIVQLGDDEEWKTLTD